MEENEKAMRENLQAKDELQYQVTRMEKDLASQRDHLVKVSIHKPNQCAGTYVGY